MDGLQLLSVFSLLIAYPLMYKVYTKKQTISSRNHIIRLVDDIITRCERRLGIEVDHDLAKVEPRTPHRHHGTVQEHGEYTDR